MQCESAVGIIPTRVARWVAAGWAIALAGLLVLRYGGGLTVLVAAQLATGAVPELRVGPYFAQFLAARLMDLGCVAGLLATAFAIGTCLTSRLTPDRSAFSALVGLGTGLWVLAVAVTVIGLVAAPQIHWVWAGALCWVFPAPRRFCRRQSGQSLNGHTASDSGSSLFYNLRSDPGGWGWVLLGLVAVAAVMNLPGALGPPFEYDELEYHLGALAEYVRAGRIVWLPHNFYSNLPQLTEMLYLLASQTSSDVAAKLLHWSFGLLTATTVYGIGARLWTRRVGLLAAALFYCTPFVQELSQTARIDLATTFFATLAFGALLVWGAEGGKSQISHLKSQTATPAPDRWLWVAALAAGGAVATKWTAAAVVTLPALVFVAWHSRSLRRVALFALLASLPVLPWLAKNWVLTGNPVYPLLSSVIQNPAWGPDQAALFAQQHAPRFDWSGWWQLLERAWWYSFAEPGAVPLLLLTAPLALWLVGRRGEDVAVRQAGGLCLLAYVGWWALTFRPWRFLVPAFPMAALVGACAVAVFARDRLTRWLLAGALGAVLAVSFAELAVNVLVDTEDPGRVPPRMSLTQYALGGEDRDEFAARFGAGVMEPVIWMNHHLPANATVLYVGEARTYYAQHAARWSTGFDRHPLSAALRGPTTAERMKSALRERGITHIYVNFPEWLRLRNKYDYLLELDSAAFRNLLQRHARVLHAVQARDGRLVRAVYELDP